MVIAVVVAGVVAIAVAGLGAFVGAPALPRALSPLSAPRSIFGLGLLVGVTLLVAGALGSGARGAQGMLVLIVALLVVAIGAAAGWAALRLRTSD